MSQISEDGSPPLTSRIAVRQLAAYLKSCFLGGCLFLALPLTQPLADDEQRWDWISHFNSSIALGSQQRREIASGLYEVFAPLHAQIPDLSPSQRQWLASERATLEPEGMQKGRVLHLYDSLEWSIEQAKHGTTNLVNVLPRLRGREIKDLRNEALAWTVVAMTLSDEEFWRSIDILRHRNVVDWTPDFPSDTLLFGYGRDIINQVVIPYLNNSLPE